MPRPQPCAAMPSLQIDNRLFFAPVVEQLHEGRRVRIVLNGNSMRPFLRPADELTLAPADGPVAAGDVVLFYHAPSQSHLLHRVRSVAPDGLLTLQGDNATSCEQCRRSDVAGRLVAVNGEAIGTARLRRRSALSQRWRALKGFGVRWLGRRGRRQLRPFYFGGLALLLWAPLNGLAPALDNYVLGIRADHLVHASVFVPCALLLADLFGPRLTRRTLLRAWPAALAVGLVAEGVQRLLPYRSYDINDLVANLIGVSLGVVVCLVLGKWSWAESNRRPNK